MDFDFRASTLQSAKHLSAIQAARLNCDKSSTQGGGLSRSMSLDSAELQWSLDSLRFEMPNMNNVDNLPFNSSGSEALNLGERQMNLHPIANEDENVEGGPECNSYTDDDNYIILDDSDSEEDSRAYFPCPFCYVEIEVPLICSHLQEEHCFDLRNAVCPLCAANLGKDVTGHFMMQHSSSLKRRRKYEKSSIWAAGSAMHGKKVLTSARGNRHETVADPLLSPFISNVPVSNTDMILQDDSSGNESSSASDGKSAATNEQDGVDEQDHQERKQRAGFVKQLIASTIFEELD